MLRIMGIHRFMALAALVLLASACVGNARAVGHEDPHSATRIRTAPLTIWLPLRPHGGHTGRAAGFYDWASRQCQRRPTPPVGGAELRLDPLGVSRVPTRYRKAAGEGCQAGSAS